jgi:hypothetical protein
MLMIGCPAELVGEERAFYAVSKKKAWGCNDFSGLAN